jgi:hypothetical protein
VTNLSVVFATALRTRLKTARLPRVYNTFFTINGDISYRLFVDCLVVLALLTLDDLFGRLTASKLCKQNFHQRRSSQMKDERIWPHNLWCTLDESFK